MCQYLHQKTYDLQKMGSCMDGFTVFSVAMRVTPNIAFFVPRNTSVDQLSSLGGGRVKVEHARDSRDGWSRRSPPRGRGNPPG